MAPAELGNALGWLTTSEEHAVPEYWVPGATLAERSSLARLGAVAAHLLRGFDTEAWPPEVRQWLAHPELPPPKVALEVEAAVEASPDEVLANLYSGLVSGSRRRILGTFFTPSIEVAPMLDLWNASQPAPNSVSDVGAGVGVFTVAASLMWPNARVHAVDVNPVTLGLLGARLGQADMRAAAARVELILDDFTSWHRSRTRPPGEKRLILGNPPYTRGQLIPPKMRRRLADETEGLCGTRASLATFMTAMALKHLEPDDGLCLLLPAQWLESEYAQKLRCHLLGLEYRRVDLRLAPARFFKDATVDAVVLLVGTERADPEPFTVCGWGGETAKTIDRNQETEHGWRRWFAEKRVPATSIRRGRPLSHFASVRRGVATGANSFFVLSEKTRLENGLPRNVVTPLVRRLTEFGPTVTDAAFAKVDPHARRWLLTATEESANHPDVAAYLRSGLDDRIHKRYLCADRDVWYDLSHDLFVPDVIITAMSREHVRVASNHANAAITNNLYGWRWHKDVSQRTRSNILEWLRGHSGQTALRSQARHQGDGLFKLEPRALRELILPGHLIS